MKKRRGNDLYGKKRLLLKSAVSIKKVETGNLGFNVIKIPLKKDDLEAFARLINLNVVEDRNHPISSITVEVELDNKKFRILKDLVVEKKIPYSLEGTGPRINLSANVSSNNSNELLVVEDLVNILENLALNNSY